jgi:two-component system chemotaxis sensor kinase CheA
MNGDQEMLDLFVQESSEHLQTLETDLIALESNPEDSALLNSIFRSVHSIKGASGFFGFDPIVKLAHVMESVMSLLRDGTIGADQAMVSLLISTSDKLNLMLAQADRAAEIPCDDEIAGLQAILNGTPLQGHKPPASVAAKPAAAAAPVAVAQDDNLPDAGLADFAFDPASLVDGLKHGQNFYIVKAAIAAEIESQGQTLDHFLSETASLGALISTRVSLPENAGLSDCEGVDVALSFFYVTALEPFILCGALGLSEENIREIDSNQLGEWVKTNPPPTKGPAAPVIAAKSQPQPETKSLVPAESAVATQPPRAPAASGPAATTIDPKPVPSARRKPEETIRINVGLLDSLMNLAGEMVLGRNRLLRIAGRSETASGDSEMQSVVQEISSVTSNLQDTIMRARLQPVGGLFGKFTRIVRDLSHKLEKEIQLEIFGDDVELDRTLLEGLSDPLTHLVRNSVDHGIESPANRVAKGKKSCGTIRLSAAHLAGRVQIEVLDDGGGMDPERLKTKAIEKGIITTDQASRMTDSDALQLIFAAGFSTAAAVSDISGRGVGMDVVKTNIEKLGGHVELDSRLGQGTRIIIRLPLTLAIVPALIVGCRGINYALPQINVDEIVHPGEEYPIKTMGGAQVLELRGQLLPVVDLSELLGHPPRESAKHETFVVVLRLDHLTYGLIVNEIISNEEIVVKPLGRHLRTVGYYSGATILGQGEIAMILDPNSMAQGKISASQIALASSKTSEPVLADSTTRRVLIFQESEGEYLAIHLTRVMRVESVSAEDIERIGPMECLRKNHDSTLRLVQLSEILPIRPPGERNSEFFLIVPRPPFDSIGIIASRIVDSVDLSDDQIDQTTLQTKGLLGSAVLSDRLSLVLDLDAIAEMLGNGVDQPSLFAQGHFLLTANAQQQSSNAPQNLKHLPPAREQSSLTH